MKKFFVSVARFVREADMLLLLLCLFSSIYGIVLISSVVRNTGGSDIFVQISALVLGIMLFVVFSYIDIDVIAEKYRFLLVFSAILISTLFIWGVEDNTGNRAWLRFGGFGGIQPAEVVKITFIFIIARLIVNHKEHRTLNTLPALLQILFVFILLFGLIILSSKDLGSALVYLFVLIVMLFIGGVKLRWFGLGFGIIAAVSPLIWNYFLSERQRNRIIAPFNPSVDPDRLGILWQPDQSTKAIASGGFSGQGLYNGRMTQAGFIPEQRTDFIFSAAGEELGFVGCLLIVLLLLLIIIRCFYVGVKSNNSLGMLVSTGIAAMLIVQTFENIGMCLGLSPVVGLTLPFFSYGGSSLVTNFAAMGIVSGIKMRPKPVSFRSM